MSAARKRKPKSAGDGGKTKSPAVLSPNLIRRTLLAAAVLAVVIIAVVWRACGSNGEDGTATDARSVGEETQADGTGEAGADAEDPEDADPDGSGSKASDADDAGSDAENPDAADTDATDAADSDTSDSDTSGSGTSETSGSNTSGSDSSGSGTSNSDTSGSGNSSDQTDSGTGSTALPEIQNTESLTVSSVYTSDILNPDCGLEYAEEVASLEITNSSDRYLVAATLAGTMSDGTEVTFQVYDLPAGATAEVFDTGNQTLSTGATCTSLTCTSEEYLDADEDVLLTGSLEITASGQSAVITNTGSAALKNLTVVYHCDMAGRYFGGASYTITIASLAAGESYTLTDSALFGAVGVVRVYQ